MCLAWPPGRLLLTMGYTHGAGVYIVKWDPQITAASCCVFFQKSNLHLSCCNFSSVPCWWEVGENHALWGPSCVAHSWEL